MKYFLDTEFIEDGNTIDLISIGIVAEDGRTLYHQNKNCEFKKASDWVWRNVFPHLKHFDMRGFRECTEPQHQIENGLKAACHKDGCPWAYKFEIRDNIRKFLDPDKHGKPEIWGYYADYDWVAFCQLFGTMIELVKGYPMYCRDVKQLCDDLGNPKLPQHAAGEHGALIDAQWTKEAWEFLQTVKKP